jgi:hypothetical protein
VEQQQQVERAGHQPAAAAAQRVQVGVPMRAGLQAQMASCCWPLRSMLAADISAAATTQQGTETSAWGMYLILASLKGITAWCCEAVVGGGSQ